jgi:hypothetical protein
VVEDNVEKGKGKGKGKGKKEVDQGSGSDSSEGSDGDDDDDDPKGNELPLEEGKPRDGIRIFKRLTEKYNVPTTRKMFHALITDRWGTLVLFEIAGVTHSYWTARTGHKGRVNWAEINRNYDDMVLANVVPQVADGETSRPAKFHASNAMQKADLDVWMIFFDQHQNGEVPWADGLLFKLTPLATAIQTFKGKSNTILIHFLDVLYRTRS